MVLPVFPKMETQTWLVALLGYTSQMHDVSTEQALWEVYRGNSVGKYFSREAKERDAVPAVG